MKYGRCDVLLLDCPLAALDALTARYRNQLHTCFSGKNQLDSCKGLKNKSSLVNDLAQPYPPGGGGEKGAYQG